LNKSVDPPNSALKSAGVQARRRLTQRSPHEGGREVNARGNAVALRRPSFTWAIPLGLLLMAISAGAQQPARTFRIGYLSSASASPPNALEAFRHGLRELGYVEGRNVLILERFAANRLEQLPELAADLVRLKPDIIVTFSTPAAKAAQQATKTIPIVMSSGDPLGSGLVASLARPGGNVTGFTHIGGPEIWDKVLELLKQIAPGVSRVGVLHNSAIPPEAWALEHLKGPAAALGFNWLPAEVRSVDEFPAAFAALMRQRADAMVAFESPFNVEHRRVIADFAIQERLPTAFGQRAFVEAGGLVSYGTSFDILAHQTATYVDKIFKGARAGDLPVQQPTKFELVINLKTAKALRLTIPRSLLLRADQIIE